MTTFKLYLQDSNDTRIAEYDPYSSRLFWQDTQDAIVGLVEGKNFAWERVVPTSPNNPAGKSKELRKIKLQLGFACNYSCTYCSQNNLRASSTDNVKLSMEKIPQFLNDMPKWFDGGENGKGKGVSLEFWGGETLLYWEGVEVLTLKLRELYPDISLALFTNGSLIKKEMVDFAQANRIFFIVSHDGPTFNEDRARDPFDIPAQAETLHYLFKKLSPEKLISFNATVSPKNYSLLKIRKYIADKLEVDPRDIVLTCDLATPYDSPGLTYVAEEDNSRELVNNLFHEMLQLYPFDMSLGFTDVIVNDFFESLQSGRTGEFVGQKCKMDLPSSLAVDLDGNALTCQNVTARGGHKIGHVNSLQGVKLNTAYHWSHRRECQKCPVVQICKGACMFLKDNLWKAACNQHFIWGLSYLSLALFLQTNRKLIRIEGDVLRDTTDKFVDVLYS